MGFSSRKRLRELTLACLICLALTSPSGHALEIEIDVLGLFKNSAILNIAGTERLLKVGERSPEGVLLVSADSQGAVIELSGEQHELDLSSRIAASFEKPSESTVTILLNELGQYKTGGAINGRSVEFLVDTGANIVAMNSEIAASLGLNDEVGRPIQVATAGGMAKSILIELDEVQVGSIRATKVRAAIIQGPYPVDILLGMSFLQDVKITESAGVMQLTGKF